MPAIVKYNKTAIGSKKLRQINSNLLDIRRDARGWKVIGVISVKSGKCDS
jgi:hypothetical protein